MTLSEGDRGTITNYFKQFGGLVREICEMHTTTSMEILYWEFLKKGINFGWALCHRMMYSRFKTPVNKSPKLCTHFAENRIEKYSNAEKL